MGEEEREREWKTEVHIGRERNREEERVERKRN